MIPPARCTSSMWTVAGGSDLADVRHLAGQAVDVAHGEGHISFLGGGEEMQDGVGRAAHRDVQPHSVFESVEARDLAREDRHHPVRSSGG